MVRLSSLSADPRKLAGDAAAGGNGGTALSTQDPGITIHTPRLPGRPEADCQKALECRFTSSSSAAWDMPWLTSGQVQQTSKCGLPMWRPHSVVQMFIIDGNADVDVASVAVRPERSVCLALYECSRCSDPPHLAPPRPEIFLSRVADCWLGNCEASE